VAQGGAPATGAHAGGIAGSSLPDKAFWDAYWQRGPHGQVQPDMFDRMLGPVLPRGGSISYFEIGCAPGAMLVHFARTYGYRVSGIDYSSMSLVRDALEQSGVHAQALIEADFTAYESDERYDVVGSFGFVEHFTDVEAIVRRQASFVRPGGYLVIEVPNLRYANYLLYRILDPALLAIHNLAAMDVGTLRRAVGPGFDFVLARPVYTCAAYFNGANPAVARHPWRRAAVRATRWILGRLHLEDVPSRLFSPYLLVVARRRPTPADGREA